MCGVDPATDATFNAEVKKHFIDGGWLTAAQIEALKKKLNDTTTDIVKVSGERLEVSVTRKRLVDGVMYIQWGERVYNAQGQVIR